MKKYGVSSKYEITKFFIGGLLKGLTYKEVTSVCFEVGFATNEYIITSVVEIAE